MTSEVDVEIISQCYCFHKLLPGYYSTSEAGNRKDEIIQREGYEHLTKIKRRGWKLHKLCWPEYNDVYVQLYLKFCALRRFALPRRRNVIVEVN